MAKKKTSTAGTCKLCAEEKNLRWSHAIPNSFFRDIQRKNNGQSILLTTTPEPIRRTNESGGDYLLCDRCERDMNIFDAYAYNWMTDTRARLVNTKFRGRIELNHNRIARFIASTFWRCAISGNQIYDSLNVSADEIDILRRSFLDEHDPFHNMSFGLADLYDGEGFIDRAAMPSVIISPTSWVGTRKRARYIGMFFIVKGFFVSLIVPRVGYSQRNDPTFLNRKKTHIVVPRMDIRSLPMFKAVHRATMLKLMAG